MKYFLLILSLLIFQGNVLFGENLQKVEGPQYIVDLRYNTPQNFLKKNVYESFGLKECFVHPDLYQLLQKLEPKLKEKNLKIVFWDCYRPLSVQREMWKLVPDARYVANPKNGSNHNRAIAVDISLADGDGHLLSMPTEFDDFSAKASPNYVCTKKESEKCDHRQFLISLMSEVGLKPLNSEWWHYQLTHSTSYPLIESLDKTDAHASP